MVQIQVIRYWMDWYERRKNLILGGRGSQRCYGYGWRKDCRGPPNLEDRLRFPGHKSPIFFLIYQRQLHGVVFEAPNWSYKVCSGGQSPGKRRYPFVHWATDELTSSPSWTKEYNISYIILEYVRKSISQWGKNTLLFSLFFLPLGKQSSNIETEDTEKILRKSERWKEGRKKGRKDRRQEGRQAGRQERQKEGKEGRKEGTKEWQKERWKERRIER